MPFRNSSKVTNRETDKTGFATYSDVYTIIQDNIDESVEFYEIEPAVVLSVFLNPSSLPKKTIEDDNLSKMLSSFDTKYENSIEQIREKLMKSLEYNKIFLEKKLKIIQNEKLQYDSKFYNIGLY